MFVGCGSDLGLGRRLHRLCVLHSRSVACLSCLRYVLDHFHISTSLHENPPRSQDPATLSPPSAPPASNYLRTHPPALLPLPFRLILLFQLRFPTPHHSIPKPLQFQTRTPLIHHPLHRDREPPPVPPPRKPPARTPLARARRARRSPERDPPRPVPVGRRGHGRCAGDRVRGGRARGGRGEAGGAELEEGVGEGERGDGDAEGDEDEDRDGDDSVGVGYEGRGVDVEAWYNAGQVEEGLD